MYLKQYFKILIVLILNSDIMKFFNFLIFTLLLLNFSKTYATGQIPDYLITVNDTLSLHCNPLESYFEKNPLPENLIIQTSTALWRGYIAYFKIENNKLVVENIYKVEYHTTENGGHKEKLISIYDIAFNGIKKVECDFYSGVLICPYGKMIEYVHMGYSSIYENYKLYEIKDGIFQKEKSFTSDEFMQLKIKHFEKYKKTEEYKKKFDELINASKDSEKEMERMFGGISDEDKKRKTKNKYLYEKEKQIEEIKMTDNFLFLFVSDNIKTIDVN
jgi:hypothetical protein